MTQLMYRQGPWVLERLQNNAQRHTEDTEQAGRWDHPIRVRFEWLYGQRVRVQTYRPGPSPVRTITAWPKVSPVWALVVGGDVDWADAP